MAISSSGPADFLVGDGEMARLVRSKDWSKTPLGPIETWPQSLRTTVSLCLASSFPINIVWGPDNTQIYNDSYRVVCGEAHPRALGEDYSVTWASAWPVIGASFEAARSGRVSHLESQRMFLNRDGRLEEAFFTFSLSPIHDETGGVGGLFHPVTETTTTMLAERRARALRDLTENLADAEAFDDVSRLTVATLGRFHLDLPFLLFYSHAPEGGGYRLATSFGLDPEAKASPEFIGSDLPSPWPFAQALAHNEKVEVADARDLLADTRCGPYEEAPDRAFVLPLPLLGGDCPPAILVAGVSARLPMSEGYRGFYELIAAAVGAAVANARTRQEERYRRDLISGEREPNTQMSVERARLRLRQTEDELAFALEAGRLGSWDIDLVTGAFVASEVCRATFGLQPSEPYSRDIMIACLHPEDRAWRAREIQDAIDHHTDLDIEYRIVRRDGAVRWVMVRGRAGYDEQGRPMRLAGVTFDVTERKRAEERQKLLLDELNHRVKNTLAAVQSISMQTRRTAESPAAFTEALDSRIEALANAHDLLTRTSWEGVSLDDLLRLTLHPYGSNGVEISGPQVTMGPNAAVTLNMAFHELATNAAKYGSLSIPEGGVDVRWTVDRAGDAPAILVDWTEIDGPAVITPARRGFGSRLLEQGVPRELGGSVALNYQPNGLVCRMRIPVSSKIQAAES